MSVEYWEAQLKSLEDTQGALYEKIEEARTRLVVAMTARLGIKEGVTRVTFADAVNGSTLGGIVEEVTYELGNGEKPRLKVAVDRITKPVTPYTTYVSQYEIEAQPETEAVEALDAALKEIFP